MTLLWTALGGARTQQKNTERDNTGVNLPMEKLWPSTRSNLCVSLIGGWLEWTRHLSGIVSSLHANDCTGITGVGHLSLCRWHFYCLVCIYTIHLLRTLPVWPRWRKWATQPTSKYSSLPDVQPDISEIRLESPTPVALKIRGLTTSEGHREMD